VSCKFPASADGREPSTPREELLCDLFAQVLGVGRVGVEDSFFDLGGNSLLATVLVARVAERFGAKISLRNFLSEPSVNGVDTHLGELLGGQNG
jgi:nonribosomal peptide synthetase DhbF